MNRGLLSFTAVPKEDQEPGSLSLAPGSSSLTSDSLSPSQTGDAEETQLSL